MAKFPQRVALMTLSVWLLFVGVACAQTVQTTMPLRLMSGGINMQQPPVTMQPGDPLRVAWDYDAASITQRPSISFRYYLDDVKVKDFVASDYVMTTANGLNTYTVNAGVLPAFNQQQLGPHTLAVTAVDSGMESAKATVAVVVGFTVPPPPPSGFRLFIPKIAVNFTTGEVKVILVPDPGGQ